MLEALLSKSPRADNVIPLLRARLAAEAQDAAEADRRATETALAAVDGDVDAKAADKAHAAALEAQRRRELTARTLAAAQVREAQRGKDDARAALESQLATCTKLTEKRAKAADVTEAAIAALVKAVNDQRAATAELYNALPTELRSDLIDGLALDEGTLRVPVNGEMARLRLWDSCEPLHAWQPFALRYRQAVDLLRERTAEFLGKQP